MKKFLFFLLISCNSHAQNAVEPNTNITPFSMPEDCLYLQWNAAVIGKKAVELYLLAEPNMITKLNDDEIKSILMSAKNLADISSSLTRQYEVFCRKQK